MLQPKLVPLFTLACELDHRAWSDIEDLVHRQEAQRTPAVPRLKLERDLATADILLSGGRGCRDAQRSARRDAT